MLLPLNYWIHRINEYKYIYIYMYSTFIRKLTVDWYVFLNFRTSCGSHEEPPYRIELPNGDSRVYSLYSNQP